MQKSNKISHKTATNAKYVTVLPHPSTVVESLRFEIDSNQNTVFAESKDPLANLYVICETQSISEDLTIEVWKDDEIVEDSKIINHITQVIINEALFLTGINDAFSHQDQIHAT